MMLSAHPNRLQKQFRGFFVLPKRQKEPRDVEQHVMIRLKRIHKRRQLHGIPAILAYLLELEFQIAQIDALIDQRSFGFDQKGPKLP